MKSIVLGCLLIGLTGCEDYSEDFSNVDAVVSKPTFLPTTLQADGESQTQIELEFLVDVPPEKAIVELKTTAGTFKETGKDAISLTAALEKKPDGTLRRIVRTQLINPALECEATLTTRSAGYGRTDKLTFTTALPDTVVIESDKLGLKTGVDNIATITVTLLRNPGRGKPAINLPVELTLQDAGKGNHGEVRPLQALSGADGTCKFLISRGADPYVSDLFVQARVLPAGPPSALYKIVSIN